MSAQVSSFFILDWMENNRLVSQFPKARGGYMPHYVGKPGKYAHSKGWNAVLLFASVVAIFVSIDYIFEIPSDFLSEERLHCINNVNLKKRKRFKLLFKKRKNINGQCVTSDKLQTIY